VAVTSSVSRVARVNELGPCVLSFIASSYYEKYAVARNQRFSAVAPIRRALMFLALGCGVAHIRKDMVESDSSDVQMYKVRDIVAKNGISIEG